MKGHATPTESGSMASSGHGGLTAPTLLITGATGFLGKLLVRELLEKTDARLLLLGRGKGKVPFEERIPIAPAHLDRVSFLTGDLEQPGLGLSDAAHREVLDAAPLEVWHLAATTDFDKRHRERIMRINVGGGTNLLEYLAALPTGTIRVLNHVSTAYVAGTLAYPDTAWERINGVPGFKNPYEESKHALEALVAGSGLPWRIFRPSVIVGDSRTGESDGKTIYGLAALIRALRRRLSTNGSCPSITMCAQQDALRNYVCVDDVVNALLEFRERGASASHAYHILSPYYLSWTEIFSTLQSLLDLRIRFEPGLDFGLREQEKAGVQPGQLRLQQPNGLGDIDFKASSLLFAYMPYMNHSDPRFDDTNTRAALPGFNPAPVDENRLRWMFERFFESSATNQFC